MLSVEPSLNQADVRRVLRAASVDVVSDGVNAFQGKDIALGYGQPDAQVALEIVNGDRAGLASTDGNFIDTWSGGSTHLEVFTIPPGLRALCTSYWAASAAPSQASRSWMTSFR